MPPIIGDASFCGNKLFQGRLIAIVSLGATVFEVWRSHFCFFSSLLSFLLVISAGHPSFKAWSSQARVSSALL